MTKGTVMSLVLALALAEPAFAADRIKTIIVDKSDHEILAVYQSGQRLRIDGLRFGRSWAEGPKRARGDKRTPEGEYVIDQVRVSGGYRYLPALHISYPGPKDVALAKRLKVDPGDAILIHGPPFGLPFNLPWEWTDGCVSVPPSALKILVRDTSPGTKVVIQP